MATPMADVIFCHSGRKAAWNLRFLLRMYSGLWSTRPILFSLYSLYRFGVLDRPESFLAATTLSDPGSKDLTLLESPPPDLQIGLTLSSRVHATTLSYFEHAGLLAAAVWAAHRIGLLVAWPSALTS